MLVPLTVRLFILLMVCLFYLQTLIKSQVLYLHATDNGMSHASVNALSSRSLVLSEG